VAYTTDPRVDEYIDGLPDWQQAICREVRDLVHSADPGVAETIKYRDRPYFVLEGNVCALLPAKDHVNVFLYDGAIVPDPEGIITGGHDNETARARWPFGRAGPSTLPPSRRCSSRSSPTTAPVRHANGDRLDGTTCDRPVEALERQRVGHVSVDLDQLDVEAKVAYVREARRNPAKGLVELVPP
jgi:hypothetical protein